MIKGGEKEMEFTKIFVITGSISVIIIGTAWSIIDKKFNYNTLLMICCAILIIAFNIQ